MLGTSTAQNPSGCVSDLFPWVETSVGAGANGAPQPVITQITESGFNRNRHLGERGRVSRTGGIDRHNRELGQRIQRNLDCRERTLRDAIHVHCE